MCFAMNGVHIEIIIRLKIDTTTVLPLASGERLCFSTRHPGWDDVATCTAHRMYVIRIIRARTSLCFWSEV